MQMVGRRTPGGGTDRATSEAFNGGDDDGVVSCCGGSCGMIDSLT